MLFRLFLWAVLSAICVLAQTERGSIAGVITDASAAPVPGARVVITNLGTNARVTLNASATGEYAAPNLVTGDYRVEVSLEGFKRFLQEPVTLTAGGSVRLDAQLQLGQINETVEVSATALQLQTENARVSTAVQNKMVDELPLVVGGAMRSPFSLVTITPESKGSGNRLSLGGGQAAAWDATLDGVSIATNRSADATEIALTAPSVEAITEFTVDTNGFKAEYGQAGGGVMTFVSKSGTNQLHGTLYEFLRNDAMDARGFFAQRRSVYKQHDFGGSLGGPVVIPKLYNGRDKTFFFLAYEGFRNRLGANDTIRSVPTPEMYEGNFSNLVNAAGQRIQIYDPATTTANPSGGFVRQPFPGNIIPQSRFSAFSRQVLPFGQAVRPNQPNLVPGTIGYIQNNFITNSGTLTTPTDKGSFKVDHMLGSKHRLGFFWNLTSYERQVGANGPPGLPLPLYDGAVDDFDTKAYRVTHDFTITPTLLNHLSIGGNSFVKNSFSPNSGQNWSDRVCMKGVVDCNVNFPVLTFTEFSTWCAPAYNGTEQPQFSIKEDLNWVRGKHTMKFGYTFQDQQANGFGQQNISGRADFSYLGTSVPGATSFTSGSSFASFLLGDAQSGQTETVRLIAQRYPYHGFYAQDDWRVTPRLTINYGLRYEFTLPPREGNDQYSDFTPDRPNPAVNGRLGALRFAGFGEGRDNTRTLVPGWYGGWGPRLGVAFSLNPRTTLRAGAGRSFSRVTVVSSSGHYSGFVGQYNFASTNQGIDPAFNVDRGLPSYPLPPRIDPTFANNQDVDHWQLSDAVRAPENWNWTFSLQRQLGQSTVVEAIYNGNAGMHLQTGLVNLNQVPTPIWDNLVATHGTTQALNIMRADINSPLARSANIPIPYANFTDPAVQRSRTVNQALRPYPQYLNVTTGIVGGDKSGHSSYHALVLKLERRYSGGLIFQGNYVFSKLLTDSDTYYANTGLAMDQYNRGLEKSIGQFDQTHTLKLNTLYELPLGRGKRWLNSGVLSQVLGGWRIGAIQVYSSGFPISLTRNNPLPLFNGSTRPVITSYENWRAPLKGDKFDPAVDRFLDRSVFPTQTPVFGNATRYNPKVRAFPNYNENISLAKTFSFTENLRMDLRGEAFNLLNRTVFGVSGTNLDQNTFGVVNSQANDPRQLQVALKLYW